jgi:Spy/CpxP family protein refolding chaperone
MSLYGKLKVVCLGLIIVVACSGAAFAQQTETTQRQDTERSMQREGRRGRRGGPGRDHQMMGMMRTLRELNLTDAQQQQTRAIIERLAQSTQPQREALRQLHEQSEQGTPSDETSNRAKQLRGELREAMQRARGEVAAILTAEQREKLERIEQERKARHEQWRGKRRAEQENEQ